MLKEGSFQELQETNIDFIQILGLPTETEVTSDIKSNIENVSVDSLDKSSFRIRKESILSTTSSIQEISTNVYQTEPIETAETRSAGIIGFHVYRSYFLAGGHYLKIGILLMVCILTQVLSSGADYWISFWYF